MRYLIFRSGAFGDVVVITPIIRHLHNQGHELIVSTSKRGMEVLKDNPHVSRLIQHKEDTPIDKLSENLSYLQKKFKCDKVLDFSESIEVALSQHPKSPNYKLSKPERFTRFNRNFYEYSFEHIGESWQGVDLRPEIFCRYKEKPSHIKDDKFNLLLGISGSGNNKTWPWSQDFAYKITENYPDVQIITVGDERCQLIEPQGERITNLCGKNTMAASMALTEWVDLVISPDTGLLHASGCFDTPKIGVLGHNTIECITKHFTNDYSVESDPQLAECSPCFFLIYDMKLQCPLDKSTGGALCMSRGIPFETVYQQFQRVYAESQKRS